MTQWIRRLRDGNRRRRWLAFSLVLAAASLVVSGCEITTIQSPLSFKADRRLNMVAPADQSNVNLPVTIRWRVTDFSASTDGNHFGVFVDEKPIGVDQYLRLFICTENGLLPPELGEPYGNCQDERKQVFLTTAPQYTISCFVESYSASVETRDQHTVAVVLLNGHNERIGQAYAAVTVNVSQADENKCQGLAGILDANNGS